MTPPDLLLVVNAAATWFMAGVIWYVQAVHYPLMARWDRPAFSDTERFHQRATGRLVAVPMLVEAVTAAALVLWRPAGAAGGLVWCGVGLVAVWAAVTATVMVPLHGRLEGGFDAALHRRLVQWNWVRTWAWTARAGLVAAMLAARP